MHFEPDHIYHVYNRGNNKRKIFFNEGNYSFLLDKISKEWKEYCDILCYCLMPNHFHFMLQSTMAGCDTVTLGNKPSHLQTLSKAIGKTLSSYTQAINKQNKTTGCLFQKKTKAKCLTNIAPENQLLLTSDYLLNCFWYIHMNPIEANLVRKIEDWPHSSWPDYAGIRNNRLCNKNKMLQLIGMTPESLRNKANNVLSEQALAHIW